MKILIDECVDQRLRFLFSGHDCETAAYAKLSGLKNGALLAAAEAADFQAIVTTDQEIPYQQNLAFRKISVIVFLSDPSAYDGGSLLVHGPYPEKTAVAAVQGTLFAFPSETTHEVSPLVRGERYTIVSWYR